MKILNARAWVTCIAAVAALLAAPAWAADASAPRGPLTLAQALDAALRNNPALAASRYELTGAQARILQAGQRLNPELSLELENFGGSGDTQGAESLETTLAFSQVIELGGKRSLRQSLAEADRDLVTLDLRAQQLDLLADVTRKYVDVVVAQQRVQFAQENAALAQKTLDAIVARVKAARSPVAEESRARIALTRATIDQRQANLALETARSALSLTWGRVDAEFDRATADLFAFAPLESYESFAARVERSPDLLRFASDARLRDAEVRLAQAQARPDISLSIGVRNLQESGDNALVAGFSMPLAVRNRYQGAIREAQARRAQSDAELAASRTRMLGTLFALYRETLAARERAQALRQEALPLARDALNQTQYGYERGRFSFLELSTSQQELLALGESAIDAAADYHRLLAELERLTSEPLTTPDLEAPLP